MPEAGGPLPRDVRRPAQHHRLRRRRTRPRPPELRRGAAGGGRGRQRRSLLLGRQGARRTVLRRLPLRPQRPADERLAARGRRAGPLARALRRVRPHPLRGGQHRRPDGRLVQPRDPLGGGFQGAQDADARPRRQGAGTPRRHARPPPRRRALHRSGAGRDRRHGVDRPLPRHADGLPRDRQILLFARLARARHGLRVLRQQEQIRRPPARSPAHLRGRHPLHQRLHHQ